MALALAESASVPVAIQLDHGKTMDMIRLCVDSGFTSVMYDGSDLPYAENVIQTRRVVDYCHPLGISVEAEIGHVGGGEGQEQGSDVDRSAFTDPNGSGFFTYQDTGGFCSRPPGHAWGLWRSCFRFAEGNTSRYPENQYIF